MKPEENIIEAWATEGFKLGELKLWMPYVRDPKTAKKFRDAGFLPSEARRWIEAGFESPAEIMPWTMFGFDDPEEAKAYREMGIEPSKAKVFSEAGIRADEILNFQKNLELSLDEMESIAKKVQKFNRKRSSNLLMRDVLQYMEELDIKELDLDVILLLVSSGIDVELVKEFLSIGVNPDILHSLVSSGFTPEEYTRWRKALFEPHEAIEWKKVKCGIFHADKLMSRGIESSSIKALEALFERLKNVFGNKREKGQVHSLKDFFLSVKYGSLSTPKVKGFQEAELLELAGLFRSMCSEPNYQILEVLGFHNEFSMVEWAVYGFSNPCEAAEWKSAGFEPPEAEDWKKAGFTLQEAADAKASGFKRADEAYGWKKEGFDIREASEWKSIWLSAATAKKWKTAGFNPNEAKEWKREGFELTEAQEWASAGLNPEDAKKWKLTGFKAHEASEWHTIGIEPSEAKGWKQHRYPPEEALKMRTMGYRHPSDIIKWQSAGFTLQEGGLWNMAGIEPEQVAGWKSSGFGPYEAGEWKSEGFGPLEAKEWSNAGYSPSTASRLKPYIRVFSVFYSIVISLLSSAGVHFLILNRIDLSGEWSAVVFVILLLTTFSLSYVFVYPFVTRRFIKTGK